MEDEADFTKLPLGDRCNHKLWKARVHGYTEAANLFGQADDEKSGIFTQFTNLIPQMAGDSNIAAQEKGLEATLLFIENSCLGCKVLKETMSILVLKCVGSSKLKIRELSGKIVFAFIEIDKNDVVLDELLKGLEQKNPKIVLSCVALLTQCLKEFGSKVIDVRPIIKVIPIVIEDRDKGVREEAKLLTVEVYRWVGESLKSNLSLKSSRLTELESEFEKVKDEKPIPTRFTKSQQLKVSKTKLETGDNLVPIQQLANETDQYDACEAVNVLSKIPQDLSTLLESPKWQERKDILENLEHILEPAKFEKGDYIDLVRCLIKVVSKDANVVVIGLAVKCIAKLAKGLKKYFQPYVCFVLPVLFDKFKEKKSCVVLPLRDAVDAIFVFSSLETLQDDVLTALNNKNPSVKVEIASFLTRSISKSPPNLSKKTLKLYVATLLQTLNEPDPITRDAAAETLGTIMKVVGEKISPFLSEVDTLKMNKIKEYCDKAVVKYESSNVVPKGMISNDASKPISNKKETAGRKGTTKVKQELEVDLTQEEVLSKALENMDESVVNGMVDSLWQTRLEGTESFIDFLKTSEANISAQVLMKLLIRKPGFKDSNFQVLKLKLEALQIIINNHTISDFNVELIIPHLVDKLGDVKNGVLTADILSNLAELNGLELVASKVLESAFQSKIVKTESEALNWAKTAFIEFGVVIDPKVIIENVKVGLLSSNASFRLNIISFCSVLYLCGGREVLDLLKDENQSLVDLIREEINKSGDDFPPIPIRGPKKGVKDRANKINSSSVVKEKVGANARVDLCSKLPDSLLKDLGDKNWKVRNEALTSLLNIIKSVKCINANVGELPTVLAQRLLDSNGKLALSALEICRHLAPAIGPACKIHVKTFLPGFLSLLSDNKPHVRQAVLACINTWGTEAGYKELFDGEIISDALKNGSPNLRLELWTFISQVLPTQKAKSLTKEATFFIPSLFNNLEDRNLDVRKAANSAVVGIMLHVSSANMLKEAEKLKPASKMTVMSILEKAKSELAVKTDLKTSSKPSEEQNKQETPTPSKIKTAVVKPSSKKKEEEIEIAALLTVNNLKQQRIFDEQKLKTLKWNFAMPRTEFVDLLRDQMVTAKVNKSLIVNMFHADFKYHLKAIESLNEDLVNIEALISNLDLVLKWMTLRFFDTNPSVLLKGLEYLQNGFSTLIDQGYVMCDTEASSFIPYLVLKIGDPKDAVRDRVRCLFKQLSLLYSPSKIFIFIIDGIKSKNARQRTECLEELGHLIANFGMNVCQPSSACALKEISKQISDRDNSVRNAALNTIVKAWFLDGNKIYKLIGPMSDKDSSLLEERIRRASKSRTRSISPKQQTPPKEVVETIQKKTDIVQITSQIPTREKKTGRLSEETPIEQSFKQMNLIDIDVSFLDAPIHIPEYLSSKMSHKDPIVETPTSAEPLNLLIQDLASSNVNVAFHGASKMRFILESQEDKTTDEFSDQIIKSLITQLNYLNSYDLETCGLILPQTYRMLLRLIDDIFLKKKSIANIVSVENIKLILKELLYAVVEDTTGKFVEGGYNKIIGGYISKIIENVDLTNVTCAVLKLLFDVVAEPPINPKTTDLTTKCLLKIISVVKKHIAYIEAENHLDRILYECHLFFEAFPQHTWKNRPSNLPLKAVKSLLLSFVQLKGRDIFSHLSLIEQPCATELCIYLKKLIKSQPVLNCSKPNMRLTQTMSDNLSDIFMKFANKETAKEGLLQFYEFKKQNPGVDLTPYLAPTSEYFQDFVANGLKEIEKEMMGGRISETNLNFPVPCSSNRVTESEISSIDNPHSTQYYVDKLKIYYEMAGFSPPDLTHLEPK